MSGAARWTCAARCGAARAGTLTVRGRSVSTPAFMPVGTYGAVKGLMPDVLSHVGTHLLVANACHLHDRPGADVVAALGGLHRFMAWDGLLLTDSGGFQVFSMLQIAQLDDEGVTFRSPIDGRSLRLGPLEAVQVQLQLDADIAMSFDHCPPLPASPELLALSVERTTRWSALARARHAERNAAGQALFGIVQGGLDDALRERSAREIVALGFDGYAVGGLSVGEESAELRAALGPLRAAAARGQVRYVMGVGAPATCAPPSRPASTSSTACSPRATAARHGLHRGGPLNLRGTRHRLQAGPLEPGCDCPACTRWDVGALRHLFVSHDPLAGALCAAHNLRHLHRLVEQARREIVAGEFSGPDADAPASSS
jgi:queuine tRNA-ribosyltransferase